MAENSAIEWRRDAIRRAEVVLQHRTKLARMRIEVARDALGHWWSGYAWDAPPSEGETGVCGSHTPIDAYHALSREEAIRLAILACLRSLPEAPRGRAKAEITRIRATLDGA